MNNIRKQILVKAIEYYGRGNQQFKAIEELSELIRALVRSDHENIAEEMADVRIMLDQLEIMFGNHELVGAFEYRKLMRLNERTHAADVVGPERRR